MFDRVDAEELNSTICPARKQFVLLFTSFSFLIATSNQFRCPVLADAREGQRHVPLAEAYNAKIHLHAKFSQFE